MEATVESLKTSGNYLSFEHSCRFSEYKQREGHQATHCLVLKNLD